MISGMVKTDCDDPKDTGSFCWTEKVQALVLGAYFYGHTVQFATVYIARRFTGVILFIFQGAAVFFQDNRFWLYYPNPNLDHEIMILISFDLIKSYHMNPVIKINHPTVCF